MANATRSTPLHLVHAPGSPMAAVVAVAHRVGVSGANAVIYGESGTGKETVARLVHAAGLAPDALFVAVACAGRAEADLAAELFGPGEGGKGPSAKLPAAAGGTLLLEDVAELPLALQARLVRAAVDASPGPAGKVRLVATSETDLRPRVAAGRFRRDLFDALACPIRLPALRERRDDVLAVLDMLWRGVGDGRELAPPARELLRQYEWPGNVREVEALARRLAVGAGPPLVGVREVEQLISGGGTLASLRSARAPPIPPLARAQPHPAGPALAHEPASLRSARAPPISIDGVEIHLAPEGGRLDLRELLRQVEATLVRWALERTKGNKAAAAGLLGLRRTTLVEKLRRLREDVARPAGRVDDGRS